MSDDLISRQAVLDLLQMKYFGKDLYMAIYNMPSAEKTGWIPCEDRLPEKAFGCLVTVEEDDYRNGEPQRVLYPDFVGYDGETWNDASGTPIPCEVIAWMPLPEPYRAESEGKE